MPVYPPYIIFLYFTFIMAEKHICSLSFSGKTSTSILNKRWRLMLTKKSLHYLFSFTTLLLPRYCSLVFSEVLRACSLTRLFAIEWSWKKPSRLPVKATPTGKNSVCITQGISLHAQRMKPTHCTDTQNDGSAFTDESYIIVSIKQLTEERCATAKRFIEKM